MLCFCVCVLFMQVRLLNLKYWRVIFLTQPSSLSFSSHRHPPRPAASDFCRQAVGRRPHPGRLQHPEGVHAALGLASARWYAGALCVCVFLIMCLCWTLALHVPAYVLISFWDLFLKCAIRLLFLPILSPSLSLASTNARRYLSRP